MGIPEDDVNASLVLSRGGWSGCYESYMVQHAVGHGGFFTQSVAFWCYPASNVGKKQFTTSLELIYDCGSGRGENPCGELIDAIDAHVGYLREHGLDVDLLVVSHFDNDHINGLKHLSKQLENNSIRVKRVWAPLLNTITRFLVALDAPRALRELILDPELALVSLFEGAEVTLVPPGVESPTPPRMRQPLSDKMPDGEAPEDDGIPLEVRDATDGVGLVAVERQNDVVEVWEILPYTTTVTQAAADLIETELKKVLGKSLLDITVDDLLRLIDVMRGKLSAQSDVITNFHTYIKENMVRAKRGEGGATAKNHASLCVYSGPTEPHLWCRNRLSRKSSWSVPIPPSWVGTGDAPLRTVEQVDEIKKAFSEARLAHVGIMSVPHHGSRLDSCEELWDAFAGLQVVTLEADNQDGGEANNHPHKEVLQTLEETNLEIIHTTRCDSGFTWKDSRYR